MSKRYYLGLTPLYFCILLLVVSSGLASLGQSFQITDRDTPGSTGELALDQTIQVDFTVLGNGTTGREFVPELMVSPSVPANIASGISTTWLGTGAITGWTSGSNETVSFYIHLYNLPSACGVDISFDLIFQSATTVTQASGGGFTNFSSGSGDGVQLEFVAADLVAPPPFPLGLSSVELFMFGHELPSNLANNPNLRIYWYIDYYLGGIDFQTMFSYFNSALSTTCFLNVRNEIFSAPLNYYVDGPITDNTVSGPPQTINPAPVGGAGETPGDAGLGVNLFDITDISLSLCGNQSPLSVLDGTTPGNRMVSFEPQGQNLIIRDVKVYVGLEGGDCSVSQTNFGTPPNPNNFRIQDFFISSIGEVDAELVAPAAWRSDAANLSPQFRVQWFLHGRGSVTPVGSPTRSLALSERVFGQDVLNPGDYFLEARINRISSNSWVSTNNLAYNHNLEYAVSAGQVQFLGAEQNFATGLPSPDDFFDPGEVIYIPLSVTDPDSGPLSETMLNTGFVLDQNGNHQIDDEDTDQFVVNPGQPNPGGVNIQIGDPFSAGKMTQETFSLPYLLLSAPERPDLWFFVDSQHAREGGATSTYRRYISLFDVATGLNGQATDRLNGERLMAIDDPDNVFGVDLSRLVIDGCVEPPGLVFESLPVGLENLTFDWFQNLNDLHDGAFVSGGPEAPFDPLTDDELYFVRISYEHPSQFTRTERILPLSVTNASNCPECMTISEALEQVLQDAAGNWPQSSSILDYVGAMNQVCPLF